MSGRLKISYDFVKRHINLSASYGMVDWTVEGELGETFCITAVLRDENGHTISTNEYVLLIGDQDEARKLCRERAKEFQAIKSKFHRADYYRFFPDFYQNGD